MTAILSLSAMRKRSTWFFVLCIASLNLVKQVKSDEIADEKCDFIAPSCLADTMPKFAFKRMRAYHYRCKISSSWGNSRKGVFATINQYEEPNLRNTCEIVRWYFATDQGHCRPMSDEDCTNSLQKEKDTSSAHNPQSICAMCHSSPWYGWFPRSVRRKMKKRKNNRLMSCLMHWLLIKKNRGRVCLRCDNTIVPDKFCTYPYARYHHDKDQTETNPSWTSWENTGQCTELGTSNKKCVDGVISGRQKIVRYCRHGNGRKAQKPSMCGAGGRNTTTRNCSVPCNHISVVPISGSFKPTTIHAWIVAGILVILLVSLIVVGLIARNRLSEDKLAPSPNNDNGDYHGPASSARDGLRISPRRIILEPEYAEVKDALVRAGDDPAPYKTTYMFATEPMNELALSDASIHSDSDEEFLNHDGKKCKRGGSPSQIVRQTSKAGTENLYSVVMKATKSKFHEKSHK